MRGLVAALCTGIVLSGCTNTGGVTRAGTSPFWLAASAPKAMRVAGGDVVLQGPAGYCIDPSSVLLEQGVTFALLGSCASIANSAMAAKPQHRAVLSISISAEADARVSASGDALLAFLRSEPGHGSIARDGQVASVSIATAEFSDGVVMIGARDQSPISGRALPRDYLRGIFDLKGRIVSVTVFGLSSRPLSKSAAQGLLAASIAQLRVANGVEIAVSEMSPKA